MTPLPLRRLLSSRLNRTLASLDWTERNIRTVPVSYLKAVVYMYLIVSSEPGILPPFPVEVVEVDGAGLVGEGGDRHDPGGSRGLDLVEEEVGEEEVAEVVRPDLHLEAVLRLGR